MSVVNSLFKEKKISKINEFELERYINFFDVSYKDNMEHCRYVLERFPRWSIISGYYAMHDVTKLFFVKNYRIKVNKQEVHATTILLLSELIKDKATVSMLKEAYKEFVDMPLELDSAKQERSKAQYYTGSQYAYDYYRTRSKDFFEKTVTTYVDKMLVVTGDQHD